MFLLFLSDLLQHMLCPISERWNIFQCCKHQYITNIQNENARSRANIQSSLLQLSKTNFISENENKQLNINDSSIYSNLPIDPVSSSLLSAPIVSQTKLQIQKQMSGAQILTSNTSHSSIYSNIDFNFNFTSNSNDRC
jgi:hypothetical protein